MTPFDDLFVTQQQHHLRSSLSSAFKGPSPLLAATARTCVVAPRRSLAAGPAMIFGTKEETVDIPVPKVNP